MHLTNLGLFFDMILASLLMLVRKRNKHRRNLDFEINLGHVINRQSQGHDRFPVRISGFIAAHLVLLRGFLMGSHLGDEVPEK